jgi:hypothetical protein
MEENQKKAFDFAADLTKQLITLATAVLAFTVTFAKDNPGGSYQKWLLVISWIMLLLSIGFGIMTLMALTGNLDPKSDANDQNKKLPILTINSPNVLGTARLQVLFFLLGIIFTVGNGTKIMFGNKPKESTQKILLLHPAKEKKGPVTADTLILDAIKGK